jgi:hypothetical protein
VRTSISRAAAVAAGLITLLLATSAWASKFHPSLRWSTLDTAHFSIHFHQGSAAVAEEMASVAEEVHAILAPYHGWTPLGRTQVVLADVTDSANGYARTVPYDAIVLFLVAPGPDSALDDHEHWLFSLFVHEYAHILQIDMVDGLPFAVRLALGRLIAPNAVLPGWLTEGWATWIETVTTRGGRARSTYTEALVRQAALSGRFPRIDTLDGFGSGWPGGNLRYLWGSRFHLEMAQRGDGWMDFHHRHSRGPIPFLLPAREAFGVTFARAWRELRDREAARQLEIADRLASDGLTDGRIVRTHAGRAYAPRYLPSGEILYVHRPADARSTLRAVRRDGSGDRLMYRGGVQSPQLGADGAIWVSQVGDNGPYVSWNDLFRIEGEGKSAAATRGERLDGPAPHPDGWLIAVTTHRGQSQLVRVDLPEGGLGAGGGRPDDAREDGGGFRVGAESGRGGARREERERAQAAVVRPWTAAADGSQYAGPTWDRAGERLAVSVWKPGGYRDIHVFDVRGVLLRSLSWDRASDVDPVWTPDGAFLVWASDRDGIWNLYAYRWDDGRVFRVTRTLGAARHPDVSPDGRFVVYQGLGPDGPRIEEIAFTPGQLPEAPLPARSLAAPGGVGGGGHGFGTAGLPGPAFPWGTGADPAVARARGKAAFLQKAEEFPSSPPEPRKPGRETRSQRLAREADVETPGRRDPEAPDPVLGRTRRYNPLRTLFPPRTLSLWGSVTDTGALGGLATSGFDALEQHFLGASVHYRTDSRAIGWAADYVLNAFQPVFSAGFSSIVLDYGRLWHRLATPPIGTGFPGVYRTDERYYERRDRFSAGVGVPIARRHVLSARYKLEFRRPLRALEDDVERTLLPARGSFSGLVFGWTWAEFRRYPASISPEDSRLLSVAVDIESTALGAYRLVGDGGRLPLHRVIVTVEGRGYLSMPWARNHVLAARFVLGATAGTPIPQQTFRIGGAYGDNAYVSLPDRYYPLRGFPTSSMRGDHVVLGAAEYRLPLFRIERGVLTAPVWLRSIALVGFAEGGQVFSSGSYGGAPLDVLRGFFEGFRADVGAELVGEAVLGWGGAFTARVGYAKGFGAGAFSAGTVYAQLGTSF